MLYGSTKTYVHATGLSCCFRQWKADSHCKYLHGYALQFEVEFEARTLDDRNWVVDFGGMKVFKEWLTDTFDHRTLVASDDPSLKLFRQMSQDEQSNGRPGGKLIDLTEVNNVGCEAFAQMAFDWLEDWLVDTKLISRVWVAKVTCREHAGNSAYVKGEH